VATSGRRNLRIAEACRQADSRENIGGDSDGDHFVETHKFQPGPHLAVKVVPSRAITDILARLRSYLKVAEENQDGSFILVRVFEGTAQLGSHDPAQVASALTKVLSQEEILSHLRNTELTTELIAAFRVAIRRSEMRAAVTALRCALDSGDDAESTYQN
jgi:hypothetical protein